MLFAALPASRPPTGRLLTDLQVFDVCTGLPRPPRRLGKAKQNMARGKLPMAFESFNYDKCLNDDDSIGRVHAAV